MMFSLSNLSKAAYGLVAGAVCSAITGTISIDHVVTRNCFRHNLSIQLHNTLFKSAVKTKV